MTNNLLSKRLESLDSLESTSPFALLLPLVGSLLITGALAALVCQPPAHPRSLPALFTLAAAYLLLAAIGHAGAVWLVHRLFGDQLSWPTEALFVGLWSTIAWLPLLTLLTSQGSLWVAATLPLMVNGAVRFLKQSCSEPEPYPSLPPAPFLPAPGLPFWRTLLPSALASAALEAAIVALASGHAWLAGTLFAGSASLPLWRLLRSPESVQLPSRTASLRKLLRTSTIAWLLTAVALLPFASSGLLADALRRTIAGAPRPSALAKPVAKAANSSSKGKLQFVILLQPPHPHDKKVAPPTAPATSAGPGAQPLVIPFDGPYWFFKHPGDQPDRTTRRERGDPRSVNIRSTDGLPLLMEAHQLFVPPLHLDAARSLQLELTNADDRPGLISAEVVLQGHLNGKPTSTSLGTLALPSSKDPDPRLGRAPLHDTLTFPLSPSARHPSVDAITIRLKPDPSRSLAAPRVSIQNFVLLP